MSKVTVHTQIINQLDGRIIVDNAPGIEIPNYNADTTFRTAEDMADLWPDCQVTVSVSNGDFACIPSRNMMKDEETMSFEDFMAKWYGLSECEICKRDPHDHHSLCPNNYSCSDTFVFRESQS